MFGVVVSGRPVLTEPQQISQTQFAFTLPAVPTFNHIVVFMVPGNQPLPVDTAAAVYIQLSGSTEFKFLGAIANEKQSAIFKVNNKAIGPADDVDAMTDDASALNGPAAPAGAIVMLGISVEPAAQVATSMQQLQAEKQQAQQAGGNMSLVKRPDSVSTKVLATRIIKNAYDFLASFGSETVPLKAFQSWWEKFEKKIENDPGFLERSDGG